MKEDKRTVRAKAVRSAAEKLGCTPEQVIARATGQPLKKVDINHVSRRAFRYAKGVLEKPVRAERPPAFCGPPRKRRLPFVPRRVSLA